MIVTILITFRKLLSWDFFFSRLEVLIGEMLETDSESGAPIHDSKVKSEYKVKNRRKKYLPNLSQSIGSILKMYLPKNYVEIETLFFYIFFQFAIIIIFVKKNSDLKFKVDNSLMNYRQLFIVQKRQESQLMIQ